METPLTNARIALRLVVFSALIAFMFLGPMATQVFKIKSNYLRSWVMFSGFARDMCTVEFYQYDEDGTATPIDRTAALGYETYLHAPKSVRRLNGMSEVNRQGRQLCTKLRAGGDPIDIRVEAMCASRKGWKAPETSENLCPGGR